MTFTPSLLPLRLRLPLHPALPPPPLLFCGFSPSLSVAPSFFSFNWYSALWNGKVIYFDSSGIWLAVLSGATCNVTGNMATVNISPPAMKSPWGQPVTSYRNPKKVRVVYGTTLQFGGKFSQSNKNVCVQIYCGHFVEIFKNQSMSTFPTLLLTMNINSSCGKFFISN